ncbi:MAG: HAMP domain-containing sensor histidine kinase, partial [Longimicrobiales bacterium]|nr:HAMP domain-containing sensor histidine kinase [Longimicrobiales bacterium]
VAGTAKKYPKTSIGLGAATVGGAGYLAGRGGKITIYAREVGGGWVSLRIRDTGPGVDPEIRDKIFEPGVTSKSGGWGVGLALSRRIVDGVHGGKIELLESVEGTTFQIRLPAADA